MLRRFRGHLHRTFLAGLFVTLPLAITAFLCIFFFRLFDNKFGPRLTEFLRELGVPFDPGYHLPGLGVMVSVLFVLGVGLAVNNYVGRKVVSWGERVVARIPYIRAIYSGAKQIIETIASADHNAFKKVVMVEFPRPGMHTLGFVASEARGEVLRAAGQDALNVFIPTVPNITTGFLMVVPRRDVRELEMRVEDGFKLILSGGILAPSDVEASPDVEAPPVARVIEPAPQRKTA